MAKVILTVWDDEATGELKLTGGFDPPIDGKAKTADTPAQLVAAAMIRTFTEGAEVLDVQIG